MRALDTQQTQVVASAGAARLVRLRVKVKDSGGTFRDLTTYPGINLVLGATWRESMDDKGITAEVRLKCSQNAISLSPLFFESPLNHAFNPASRYAPMLAPFREVQIEWAVVPDSTPVPAAGDWKLGFHGRIDKVSWPGDELVLECRDLSGLLQDTFLKVERVYAYAQGVTRGCRVFQPVADYAVGELVMPSTANLNGHFYEVLNAGTTDVIDPAWPTGSGAPITSDTCDLFEAGVGSATAGTAVQTCMQAILNDAFGAGVITLYTPVSPGWNVKWWLQKRGSVLDALRTLAEQIGWDVRYKWDSGTSAFRLTLWQPPRSKTVPDRNWAPSEVLDLGSLEQSLESIRNVVRVTYSDSADLDSKGFPKRKAVAPTNAGSIAAYGERWMEIQESSASNIDTGAEASAMANAILDDLSAPNVDLSVDVLFFPWAELGDLYRFLPDGWRYTQQQDLALVSYEHSVTGNKARSSFSVRGKPSGGYLRWLAKAGELKPEDVHADVTANVAAPFAVTTGDVIGGVGLQVDPSWGKNATPPQWEWHVSENFGFNPGLSTLKAAGGKADVVIADLVPGKQYYARAVPFGFNASRVVQGAPSPQVAFVAGRAQSGHYSSTATQSHLPLNGNFEHATEPIANAPFDHWKATPLVSETETWAASGAGGSVFHGTDADKGGYVSLLANASKRGRIVSSAFEVRRGIRAFNIYLSIRRLVGSGSGSPYDLIVDIFGYSDSALATQIINYSVFLSGSASGAYPSLNTWYDAVIDFGGLYGTIPTNVNFMQLAIRRSTAGSTAVAWDIGDVYVQESDFYRLRVDNLNVPAGGLALDSWTAPTFINSWANYGGTLQTAGYYRDPMGRTFLRGLIKRTVAGGTGVPFFNLPLPHRPAKDSNFAVMADNKFARVEVQSGGDVYCSVADSATPENFLSLDGISFDAR